MDKKELRLGNIISFDGMEHIVNETTFMIHESKLEPIPLTEDWLLRFGFKFHSESYGSKSYILNLHNGLVFGVIGSEYYFPYLDLVGGYQNIGYANNPIKYVNQLQNIYHALSGEELDANF